MRDLPPKGPTGTLRGICGAAVELAFCPAWTDDEIWNLQLWKDTVDYESKKGECNAMTTSPIVKKGHRLPECATCFNTLPTLECAAFSEPLTGWSKCPAWNPDRNFLPRLQKLTEVYRRRQAEKQVERAAG